MHFGAKQGKKQSSLMYNIWKDCIIQREKDEMILTLLVNFLTLSMIAVMNQEHNLMVTLEKETFEGGVLSGSNYDLLPFLDPDVKQSFCEGQRDISSNENVYLGYFLFLIYLITLGSATSVS